MTVVLCSAGMDCCERNACYRWRYQPTREEEPRERNFLELSNPLSDRCQFLLRLMPHEQVGPEDWRLNGAEYE